MNYWEFFCKEALSSLPHLLASSITASVWTHVLGYRPTLSLVLLLTLASVWPLGSLSGWLLCSHPICLSASSFVFLALPYSLAVQDAPGSSAVFLASTRESVVSRGSSCSHH